MIEQSQALEAALRALRARDRSAAELKTRLSARGTGVDEREEVLELLERAGYVDDGRFAHGRALALAARGSGDALIRNDLEQRGIADEAIEIALASLEPEHLRAARIASTRGRSARTARYLAARGFDEDTIVSAVAREDDGEVE